MQPGDVPAIWSDCTVSESGTAVGTVPATTTAKAGGGGEVRQTVRVEASGPAVWYEDPIAKLALDNDGITRLRWSH